MVLHAFAAHSAYRHGEAAILDASLLKSRFSKADVYTSYKSADHWLRIQYPFWWNNLVSALYTISLIDPSREDPNIQEALGWFIAHQHPDGLWLLSYSGNHKTPTQKSQQMEGHWLGLAISRIFKKFFDTMMEATNSVGNLVVGDKMLSRHCCHTDTIIFNYGEVSRPIIPTL